MKTWSVAGDARKRSCAPALCRYLGTVVEFVTIISAKYHNMQICSNDFYKTGSTLPWGMHQLR